MKFEEWKKEFSKKCDTAIESFKDMHLFLEEIDEDVDEDEFILFVTIKSRRFQKAIAGLK
jgi:hypothetical protein